LWLGYLTLAYGATHTVADVADSRHAPGLRGAWSGVRHTLMRAPNLAVGQR